MKIEFEPNVFARMAGDAENTFPNECCGFLFGKEENELRYFSDILQIDNRHQGNLKRRFSISPLDYIKAEGVAVKLGLDLLGIYHSHPDHPAIPSEHDRISAQPFFSYLILSIRRGQFNSITSWQLNEEFQFQPEEIILNSGIIKNLVNQKILF